jgi:diketogulonate reductase-like aldo/keto reductase
MRMPPIGFGCSPFRPGERRVDLEGAVRVAVAAGYRLFDLAELYGNERAVGRSLQGLPRHDLFIVGKAWRTSFRPAALRQSCEDSLRRLGVEAFDLYLLHAPEAWKHSGPLRDPEEVGWEEFERRALPRDAQGEIELDEVPLAETWEAMRDLAQRGLTGSLGVSNFGPEQLDALGAEKPAVNQIARSPYQPNAEVVDGCRQRGIGLMAHSPMSAAGLLGEPLLAEEARRLHCTPAQVVLRWNLARGIVPLPSSADPDHIAENLRALDGELDPAAMAAVDSLAARTVDSPR